ncbi:endonuclease [Streptomyces indicus]|uniref:Endonuclease III n=1 Tax=Streptomyces indicus TaxID=417292 RepID=A0A1G8TSL6_9ACTN|nr:endonuclease [Streptomyces indicus]SDJ44479.1 hypothetical protein SAMN05421806_101430 [Streptomyces indicus]
MDGAARRSRELARTLLGEYGRTYAQDAGIRLRNTPQPLYQLLVLSCLLSARIRSATAVAAARALFGAGLRDATGMAESGWQERVDALGRGGYRRYDERTATQLGEGAELLREEYGWDLRRLRDTCADVPALRAELQRVPGLGPAGADIFVREVQGVWPETAPYFGQKALDGAERLGLPRQERKLAALVDDTEHVMFAAALVRAALDRQVAADVMEREHASN